MAIEASPSIEEIVDRYPHEFIEGTRAKRGTENPYPQSFHFQLTVNDAKYIAWREGNKLGPS